METGHREDELCDALWGEHWPDGAITTLRVHRYNLRRALKPGWEIVMGRTSRVFSLQHVG
jgi:DNA-binding SARP family transcriptional activator